MILEARADDEEISYQSNEWLRSCPGTVDLSSSWARTDCCCSGDTFYERVIPNRKWSQHRSQGI